MTNLDVDAIIDLATNHGKLRAAATKVLADWHASERMAGQVIHSTECGEFCKCKPSPKAPKWASLSELESLLAAEGGR